MNKKQLLLLASGAIIITLVAMVCTFALRGSSDAYALTLPSDANAIVRMDAKAFLQDADLSLKEIIQLWCRNQQSDDNQQVGIDMQRPIYAFASPSGYFGIAAAVNDEEDLAAFCKSFQAQGYVSEAIQQRGYSWVVVAQQWLLAYDSEKALLMGPAVGSSQDQLRGEMARLLGQKRNNSGLQSSLFAALKKSDEPLAAIIAPEILPAPARKVLRRCKVASQADALLRLTLQTDDNVLEVGTELLAENEDVKAEIKHMDELLRPITGALMDNAHSENVAWMTMNVEGATLLDALRSNQAIRTALLAMNFAFDLDRIIRAVDGDVTLEITNVTSLLGTIGVDFQLKDIYLAAEVAHTDFLSNTSTWGSSLFGVQPLTSQDFALNMGTSSFFFGVEDKTFYFGSQQGLAHEKNDYLRDQRSDIKDKRFYATFAVPTLVNQLGAKAGLPASVSNFERFNIQMEHFGDFKLQLLAPPGTNIAREIILNR